MHSLIHASLSTKRYSEGKHGKTRTISSAYHLQKNKLNSAQNKYMSPTASRVPSVSLPQRWSSTPQLFHVCHPLSQESTAYGNSDSRHVNCLRGDHSKNFPRSLGGELTLSLQLPPTPDHSEVLNINYQTEMRRRLKIMRQVWWHILSSALGRRRQEDHKSEASLGYIPRPCLMKPLTVLKHSSDTQMLMRMRGWRHNPLARAGHTEALNVSHTCDRQLSWQRSLQAPDHCSSNRWFINKSRAKRSSSCL